MTYITITKKIIPKLQEDNSKLPFDHLQLVRESWFQNINCKWNKVVSIWNVTIKQSIYIINRCYECGMSWVTTLQYNELTNWCVSIQSLIVHGSVHCNYCRPFSSCCRQSNSRRSILNVRSQCARKLSTQKCEKSSLVSMYLCKNILMQR